MQVSACCRERVATPRERLWGSCLVGLWVLPRVVRQDGRCLKGLGVWGASSANAPLLLARKLASVAYWRSAWSRSEDDLKQESRCEPMGSSTPRCTTALERTK